MQTKELPLVFDCQGKKLIGIVHHPDSVGKTGVLIVVGGPQYRVGSHRQFVLLARSLALHGLTVMRFDFRGMGDSEGYQRRFDQVDEDIRAAVDCFLATCPQLDHVVLWGLCDAASASIFYAYQDDRIKGMVLLNPWVFTEQGAAKAYLKHYYLQRLMSRDFWVKVFRFNLNFGQSVSSLFNLMKQAIGGGKSASVGKVDLVDQYLSLPTRMRECFARFAGPVLLILSGRDLTADEFKDLVTADPAWQKQISASKVIKQDLVEADHTFSSVVWRDQVANYTLDWLKKMF
jgi:exosortase A-associated hydrolase 1